MCSKWSMKLCQIMIPVRTAEDFASAVREKLLLEVSGLTPGWTALPAAGRGSVDCLIGTNIRAFLRRHSGIDSWTLSIRLRKR